ncbi:MAG: FGGY-family carbohydrate kinase [Clostridia bacterium]|nr:FGGY-family carbohydrate kinase [Clostridia bacterium]
MNSLAYVISYDIGTTGVKTCLFSVTDRIDLICAASYGYPLYTLPDGGAEQDGDDWWGAMCQTTRHIFEKTDINPDMIEGISFCSQMQALVLVDKDGNCVRRPMSYMDQRAKAEIKKGIANGIQIAGANIFKLIPSLIITGAVSSSVKDPIWKYKWVESHEPENLSRAYCWFDVKDYLICRCTGEFAMTEDSAFATLLYDTRRGKKCWSKKLCKMFGINEKLLPRIISSTDKVGGLTENAARELGLTAGTPVFGGGGDSSLIGVGAGCVNVGQTHIYSGTSGWVSTVTDRQLVDTGAMIAAITGAQNGKFNYFAEMETANKCLEWCKDHLALDEIGIYNDGNEVTKGYEKIYTGIYDRLTASVKDVPAGSGGVIFTPWLHGNRCPFEDPYATGMFFGIKLETGKRELVHAVLEGIFYHLRWMLECQDKKVKTSEKIRFVGGGALSAVSCQMLADIIGREVEVVDSPQSVGAVGAAAVTAVGLGLIPSLESVRDFIPVGQTYVPDKENHEKYGKYFATFKEIYKANKKLYRQSEV